MVHEVPGHPESDPQSTSFPKSVLFTMTSTPAGPLVQVSVPVRSVAPMIFEVTVSPGWMS
jgi:hypothetical protein